jgi:hypothetical protein
MQTSESLLSSIEAVVNSGKAVISADNSSIIAMVQEAVKKGRSGTIYVSPEQFQAVMRWYWTPRRIKEVGLEPVSKIERARIESELGVKDMGEFFSNRLQCPCGGVYGAFEFMKHGVQEHGRNWVGAVLELKNTAVIRVNPATDAICPDCKQMMIGNHWYEMPRIYGCCSGEIPDIA